jgi:hypothetical protein
VIGRGRLYGIMLGENVGSKVAAGAKTEEAQRKMFT